MFKLLTSWLHSSPKPKVWDDVHKKKYYDLPSVQAKLGLTQGQVDVCWERRVAGEPVYLISAMGRKWFISNYNDNAETI